MSLNVYLLKQPYEVSFSGNPMPFSFSLAPYRDIEKLQDISLQVRILVEQNFGSNLFTEVKSQNFYPTSNGMIELDIHTVIDPYLDFYLPPPSLQKPVQAFQQRARYKVTYILQKDGAIIGGVQNTQVFYAVKGGMAYQEWHPTEFFSSLVTNSYLPLSFPTPGEKTGVDETKFLYWVYPYNDNAPQTVIFTVNLSNGTNVSYALPATVTCGKWGVCCTPAGFKQLSLDALVLYELYPVSYSVRVKRGNLDIVLPVTFTIDHRNFYKSYQLIYRNSLGGLQTIRLRGQVDFEADYTMQQAQRIVPPAYFHNMTVLSQSIQDDNEETAKYKADTGFISVQAADQLRDLFLSPERYEVRNNRFVPVILNNKNVKFYSNKDNLISTQIEWNWAFPNSYYTPEGLMPSVRSCPAVETLTVKQATKDLLQIMYALVSPYETVEVQIIIGSTTYTYTYVGNSKSLLQPFANPATGTPVNITIKARTVCDENSSPVSYGPFSTVVLSVIGNSLVVVNDDNFSINGGFNSAVTLKGSVLDNDYDPDGDAIEAVAASGSTNAGGTYTINAAGVVTYTPPFSSYNGIDYFTYAAREVGSTTSVAGKVNITVGSNTSNVFVKLVTRNTQSSSSANGSTFGGEVWMDFFGDPSATQIIDLTGINIAVNIQQREYRKDKGTGNDTTTDTTQAYQVTGTKVKIYDGLLYSQFYDPGFPYSEEYSNDITILPGAGYVGI